MNKEIIQKILEFRNQRNWLQFHNPKDLAISICLESAELLETFQWSGSDTEVKSKIERQKEELADILIYCTLMADTLHVDMDNIIKDKLEKNECKYKVSRSFGNSKKYTELEDKP